MTDSGFSVEGYFNNIENILSNFVVICCYDSLFLFLIGTITISKMPKPPKYNTTGYIH